MNCKKTISSIALAAAVIFGTTSANAAGGGPKPPAQDWSFMGIFGTYDKAELQRGFQVFKQVCANCHSMNLMAFRNLADLGYNEDEIKAIAAEYQVQDGPNDDGDMFERAATPADRWPAPFPNDKAAASANGGSAPPDLSLMAKARGSGGDSAVRFSMLQPSGFPIGADYLYALLTGYEEHAPEGISIPEGKYYNHYFPGHAIAMAPPLADDAVEYGDGTPATVNQMAHDVSVFMNWISEPELNERKNLGVKVMLFLIVLTIMLYALKRKIWANVH